MDLSAQIARNIVKCQRHSYKIALDLCPQLTVSQLQGELQSRLSAHIPTDQLFYGILHNKMAQFIIETTPLDAPSLAKAVKTCIFAVDKLLGYEMSQVTAGGVKIDLLSPNMQLPNGVYAVGEIVNVDGNCGGYNLLFATLSALATLPLNKKDTILAK